MDFGKVRREVVFLCACGLWGGYACKGQGPTRVTRNVRAVGGSSVMGATRYGAERLVVCSACRSNARGRSLKTTPRHRSLVLVN
jgi:hypothetical protein